MLTPVEFEERLTLIKCFALDMDGTIYLGDSLFPATPRFLQKVQKSGRQYLFLTNNSSLAPVDYTKKLHRLGIEVPEDRVYTSADATVEYLLDFGPGHRLCVLGTSSLINFFESHGFVIEPDKPDALVLGFDLDFDYSRFYHATKLLRRGVPFFATHPDLTCPVENGEAMPDCGALALALTAASGVKPKVLGKPHAPMIDGVLRRAGVSRDELAIIGDRLETDIRTGTENDVLSILVLTGEATREDLDESEVKPDFVVESLDELRHYL